MDKAPFLFSCFSLQESTAGDVDIMLGTVQSNSSQALHHCTDHTAQCKSLQGQPSTVLCCVPRPWRGPRATGRRVL